MPPEPAAGPTIEGLLAAAARDLAGSSGSPRLDAELLLAHALGWDRSALYREGRATVAPAVLARFHALLAARQDHRPVAQLTGRQEFWSLALVVSPAVLTPRPETELLVEAALARLPADAPVRVLDLGTGSGAIAFAVAMERPRALVTGTDLSPAALAVARENASRLGLERVRFLAGNWYEAVGDERFDLILSNPPYIAAGDWAETSPELRFEPAMALEAGADGLDALGPIVAGARPRLQTGGWLLVEHGWRQGPAVVALMEAAGLAQVLTLQDLAGRPRVTAGRRS